MRFARVVFPFGAMVLCAVLAQAQGAPDFSKVEIKANQVTDKFYTLDGQGGRSASCSSPTASSWWTRSSRR